jgi:NADP-dependent 3-hydroxy acid dehydrogenase YdfG
MSSKRQSIFITGAASGMGLATARLFAEKGWFVGACDVNEPGLESLASEIGVDNCYITTLDVSDRSAYQNALHGFGTITEGRLDLLFNNAGIIKDSASLFGDMDFAVIEEMVQVNLMGVLNGIHSAYEMLKNTPNSLCFSTSSSSAIIGAPGLPIYSATKHAIKGLTESLSSQLALHDIRVADTLPGHIKTGLMPDDFAEHLPQEGIWRVLPAEAVAEVVWASYHDKKGKLHWYVPEDLFEYQQSVTADIEAVRNSLRQGFVAMVEAFIANMD